MNRLILFGLIILLIGCGSDHTESMSGARKNENTEEVDDVELTFDKNILAIIEARCSLCHTGDFLPDWSIYENVITFKDEIYKRVVINESMPLNNQTNMTSDERLIFKEWIEAGALK